MRPPSILAISTSMKPADSASRNLLAAATRLLREVYPNVTELDLRDAGIPHFSAQYPSSISSMKSQDVLPKLIDAAGLLIAVPCYWASVAGTFKNMVDVLCGASYDNMHSETPFAAKPIGLIIVGTDDKSAKHGHADALRILRSAGACPLDDSLVIGNPRSLPQTRSLHRELTALIANLAKRVLLDSRLVD